MFVDTHCHIYDEYYDDIEKVLKKIKDNNIGKIINNGCDAKSNIEVLKKVSSYDFMYGALGIHPESVLYYKKEDIDFIEQHLNDEKIVAIGEIGLDYHYGKENKETQIILFEEQLKLAEKYNKPVIIHSRDATLDTIETIKKYKVRGVIHSFSGSLETANIYLKLGFLLGVNGVITFKNCNLKDVIKEIPVEKLVLETDSPYLTPVPFRGERNDSSHINEIAEFVASLKGVSMELLANITNENIHQVFDI